MIAGVDGHSKQHFFEGLLIELTLVYGEYQRFGVSLQPGASYLEVAQVGMRYFDAGAEKSD
jgi:hypothetical protein